MDEPTEQDPIAEKAAMCWRIMNELIGLILVAFAYVSAGALPSASAQAIGGSASISVTSAGESVALPVSVTAFPAAMLVPAYGTNQEIFYALGGSSVAATTSSAALPPNGICLNVGPNTYVAAITSTSTATLRITQLTQCPPSGF